MRHMRSRRILAMLLALSMIFGLLTTTALADNEVDQNTSNVGESAANGTSAGGSGEGQSSGASEDESSTETNKEDVPTEEETIPEEKKTTSSEEVDTQVGEGMEVPTATTIATDEALINAINNAVDGDTITLAEGQYQISDLIGLSNANKAVTISAETNATVILNAADGIALHGAKITFNGITFQWGTANYKGIQHASELEYNDCIINGKVFLYAGKETFNHCTFNQDSADYCVWTYGAAETTFNNCTFNCKGKAVLVYNEGYIKTVNVEVNNTTFAASETVDKKAAIELDTHLMKGASINVDNASTATGFSTNTTDGAGLWNAKRIDSENNETVEVVVGGEVKYTLSSAPVAMVNGVSYNKLEDAFAALSDEAYTLTLNDESAWDTATPVYWAAGEQSGYAATLAEALTKAYMQSAESIKIICRPDADVGTMTHGHAADNLTIYGNKAYISAGECDLEVDTFKFDRSTGRQATDGVTLDKDITITAYELDNLGVWGERHTNHTVNVNLTDCDTVQGITVQRVYISGTTGMNNITLSGCNFGTEATSVYSNADGDINITNCSFTGAQVPVNFNHKAGGEQTLRVSNCEFNACGEDEGDWAKFAAPVRFVNSGSGKQSATVDTCTFTDTVGANGDILIGDGRTGQESNDVNLTVTNTAATVMAQKPGYYTNDGTTDNALKGEKALTAGETLTNASINSLISGTTATKGTEANPYTLGELGEMTRDAYIAAQKKLGGTMYVSVGDYSYGKDGVLGNGKRDDTTGHTEDRNVLNGYNSNGYLGEKNDGANGLNIVFVNGSITSGVKGYTSIDNIGTSLLLAVPDYTNVTFKGITFNNVMCFNYQLYTSPWSQLGELKFDGCTFNGIIVGATAAQTLTFNGCTFTNFTNTTDANSSNPTWIRPAYGNWTPSDNKGQGSDFRSLTTINFTNNTVTSTRPVKFEYISQWNNTTTLTATGNSFDISAQKGDTKVKNVGMYFGSHTDENAFNLVLDRNEKIGNTAALYTLNENQISLPVGSTVKDPSGNAIEITDALEWKTENPITSKTEPVPAVKNVAKVGDTEYATLEAAVENANAGDTVTLLADINDFGGVSITKNLTVDFGAHTITGAAGAVVFNVENATVTLNGTTGGIDGGEGGNNVAVRANTGSDITINGGVYTVGGDADGLGNSTIHAMSTGKVTINGGTFSSKAAYQNKYYVLNIQNGNAATITVNGGSFENFDPFQGDDHDGGNFCADGVGVDNVDGTFTAVKDMTAQILDADGSSVKAYDSLAEAIAAAEAGQTVRLLANATEDVTIDKNITLDLGGKTLTNTGAGKATITIAKDATATVKNGTVKGGTSYYNIQNNGTATFEGLTATAGNTGSSMIDNWGTLTIESGTYTGGLNVVKSEEDSTLVINGGTFTLDYATSGYTGVILVYGDTTITGGEFIQSLTTTGRWNHPQVIATGVVEGHPAITRVTGGMFTNKMSGEGIFRGIGKATSDNFEVSGGTFNKSISDAYCADGFIPTKNADGTYGVKEGKYVAKIGSTGYETLAAAIAKANSKSKPVTLVADVTESIEIAEGKTCKINLNGFTLTNTEGSHTIVNNGTLTITDSSAAKSGKVDNVTHARAAIVNYGTMTLAGGAYTRSLENPENNKDSGGGNSFYTILNDKGGSLTIKDGVTVTNVGHFSSMICNGNNAVEDTTLTIEGGLFSGGINTIKNGEFGKLTINGGSFTNATQCVVMNWNEASITGGTFELASGVNSTLLFSVAWSDHAIGKMTISGGTFKYTETQGLVQDTYDSGKYTGTLAVSGGTFDCAVDPKYCAEGFEPTKNVDGTYGVKETLAAKIGTTEYDTLAAAFAAAKDGETIVLLKNSSGNGIQVNTEKFTNQGLTVDFNGHTYTVGGVLVGSTGTGTNAFQLLAGGKVTFMNGSIVGVAEGTKPAEDTPNWHGAPAMMIQNYCDLTLQSMTISGGDETVYTMSNNHGNVVIKDTTINAGKAKGSSYSPYAFDVCGYGSYTGVSVSVENSTINGNIELSKSKGNTYDATLTLGSGTTVNGSISVGDNGDKVAVTKDNSVDVTAPDGYKWVDGETGQTLAKIVMVAEVNGTGYETLAEAFAAATDNSTIKLLTDITLEGTTGLKVKAENAMNIVFDLNGHSITGSALSATTPALYIVSACGRDTSGSVKIINSSTEKAAISAKLPLQIFGSSYADEVRVEIDENVTLEVLEGGTNAIKMVQSAAYLVATEHTKTFYKNGGFMTTVNDEERIHEELSSAQKFSKNVKLLNDFATSSYLKIWDSWGTVTLDLDGHTYKSTAKVNMFELQEGANITFKKGTLKGSGDSVIGMPYNNSTLTLDSVAVENTGNFGIATNGTTTNQTVTINNSTIKVPNGMGVYFPSTGKLTINGGSIEANTGVQICAGSLEITGNPTIKATATAAEAISSGSILDGAAVSIVGGRSGYGAMGQVTIDSGSFTSASGIEAVQAYTVNSNNQKADWTDAEAKVNISGGSYSTPVRENLCAEGFVPVTNGDGTYGVQPDGNVAEIGSVKYASLDEALKAAKDRETVKLLKDVEATQVLVTKGTLDLNGKTLKVSYFMSFSDVIDSTEGNGLIETGVQSFFTTNNSYLPLRDSAANGYRLFSYKLNKLGVVEGSSTAFWFNIIFGGEKAYSLLNTAGHNADLFIPMQIGSGNEWQYIKMNQSTLTKWTTPILNGTAPSRCGYYVNITGLNTLTSGTVLTLKTSIRSCGVEKLSDDSLTYTVK